MSNNKFFNKYYQYKFNKLYYKNQMIYTIKINTLEKYLLLNYEEILEEEKEKKIYKK